LGFWLEKDSVLGHCCGCFVCCQVFVVAFFWRQSFWTNEIFQILLLKTRMKMVKFFEKNILKFHFSNFFSHFIGEYLSNNLLYPFCFDHERRRRF
jgi:hypothetical protein